MKTLNFENFATELTGKNIKLYKPENDSKYAIYHKYNGLLEPNTKYGILFNDNIQYDFKTTSKIDTFLKSFVNQHINKYECKQYTFEMIDGKVIEVYTKKENVIKKYRDQNRVNKYFYYTTLYGIGMFSFFTQNVKEATKQLTKYLNDKNIKFYNEFSDAGWAYRFVINKDVKTHNNLLESFEV